MHPSFFCVVVLVLVGATLASASVPYTYETHQITQFVDHYSLTTNRTFQQKYLVNKDYWCGNGCPILFFCGHDGRDGHIEGFANENTGWMWDYGKQLQAMIVFAEHRYYGDSKPFSDLDETKPAKEQLDKLGYLTSQQALADYAQLIHSLKHHIYSAPDSPVVAVGGAYGGLLSAWLRMKYPNAVIGAWGSSAPMLQYDDWVDCRGLSQLASREYAAVSENCRKSVAKSWNSMFAVMSNPKLGLPVLSATMNMCKPLREQDVEELLSKLAHVWYFLLMSDYPNESHYYVKLPADPLSKACKLLEADPDSDTDLQLVEKISKAVHLYLNYDDPEACFDLSKPLFPQFLFEFQAWVELVLPHCTDGVDDMFFPFPYNKTLFTQHSLLHYDTEPRFGQLPALYHHKDLSPYTNLIFTLPTRDPYYAASIQDSIPERSIHALKIEGAAWMEELRGSAPNDSDTVRSARQRVANILESWIEQYNNARTPSCDNTGRSEL